MMEKEMGGGSMREMESGMRGGEMELERKQR